MPFLAPIFIALAAFIEFHAVLATILFGIASSIALSGVSRLLTPKPKSPSLSSTGSQVTLRQAAASWRVIYGDVQVGGIITYIETTGSNNEYLHLVITLAGHLVHAIGSMYFDGTVATEDGTFVFVERNLGTDTQAAFSDLVAKSAGKWTTAHQQKGRAGVHVRLKWDPNRFPNGVPNITFDISGKELYDPRTLATAFGHNAALALADYLTNTNYGLAVKTNAATRIQSSGGSTVAKLTGDTGVSSAATDYEALLFLENIGAKDVTVADHFGHSQLVPAGTKANVYLRWTGDGTLHNQILFNAPTSGDSLDFLVSSPVVRRFGVEENQITAGDRIFTGSTWTSGTGAAVTKTQNHMASMELDRTQLIAAANTCDEDVSLKAGGTEKRFTCNGSFDTSTAVGENIQSLLTTMAGRLTYTNAIFNIYPGQFLTPGETISEGDLRDTISVQTTRSKRDLFNGVKGVFVSPLNKWQPTDFPPYQNLTYKDRDGEELWKDVQLPFTTSVKTAQRLAKIELERIRRQVQVVFKCKLTKWTIAPLGVIQVNNTRFGWVNKTFEVVSSTLAFEANGNTGYIIGVDIIAIETDSNVYAWDPATEEGVGEVTGSPTLPGNTVSPVTAVTLASGDTNSLVVDGIRYARLKVSWTLPADQFVISGGYHDVYYRIVGSGTWIHHGRFDGSIASVLIGNVAVGSSYEAFVRSTNVNGIFADSSTSASHTVTITLAGSLSGAALRPYIPLSNPLTAHDAGSNATLNAAAFTMRIQGFGDVSYNSGSITGLAYGTLYYIYYDDSAAAGGTVSFVATTTKEVTLNNGARFFLGSIVTPQAGALDTIGFGDGGSAGSYGMTIKIKPTVNINTGNNLGNGTITNPDRAYDGDVTSFCSMSVTGDSNHNKAFLQLYGFPVNQRFASAKIAILWAVPTNTLNKSGNNSLGLGQVAISTNAPSNITSTVFSSAGGGTQTLIYTLITVPPGTDVSSLVVNIALDTISLSGFATGGTLEFDLYDVGVNGNE